MKKQINSILITFVIGSLLVSHTINARSDNDDKTKVTNKPKQTLENPYQQKPPQIVRPKTPINPNKAKSVLATKPTLSATSVRTKTYRIPGPLAIVKAKKHGYTFSGDHQKCKFNGSHAWTIQPAPNQGTYCKMKGFSPLRNQQNCNRLRNGWKIIDMKFYGKVNWHAKYTAKSAGIMFSSENDSRGPKMVMLKTLVLEGPTGPQKKFEDAFSHCSDPQYRH